MSDNELLLLHMDESRFLALEEQFYREAADMVSMGGDLSPLELDDEWFRILSVEEESFCRQVSKGRFAPAADNGDVSTVTNCTPHTTMEPPHTELPSDFEEPEEMHEFDEEEGLPRDFEEHEEVFTTTDGDELDDLRERPRDFGESMELTREEEAELFSYYEEMRETYSSEFEISEGKSGIQWRPRQIKDFLQTLTRIETGTLGPDDLRCAICKSEFGNERGEGETSDSGQGGLPGEESAEYPVKLPCGHVFGLWCIETWLLNAQPASCPLCRYLFQPG